MKTYSAPQEILEKKLAENNYLSEDGKGIIILEGTVYKKTPPTTL